VVIEMNKKCKNPKEIELINKRKPVGKKVK
jgi:hypothetical protein